MRILLLLLSTTKCRWARTLRGPTMVHPTGRPPARGPGTPPPPPALRLASIPVHTGTMTVPTILRPALRRLLIPERWTIPIMPCPNPLPCTTMASPLLRLLLHHRCHRHPLPLRLRTVLVTRCLRQMFMSPAVVRPPVRVAPTPTTPMVADR